MKWWNSVQLLAPTAMAAVASAQTASNTVSQVASNAVVETRIEVVASPITDSERFSEDGADSVVVGRQQIERLNAADLPTALRQVPGVTISRFSPVGAYGGAEGGSVYIRGAGTARPGSEITIYSDGVPRESGVWAHPLLDIVPIDFADRVTVAKNPQPQNYAGTFGAVDIETRRRYEQGHEGELDVAYGRYNTLITSASAGGKIDLFDYYAGSSYKYSDGERAHSGAELVNVFARAGWDLSAEDHISYIFQHTDNWVRDPGAVGTVTPVRDQFNTKTDTHTVKMENNHDNLKGYALAYYEEGEIRWHKDHIDTGKPAGYSNTDWWNYGFRSSYDVLIDRLTLTGSLDAWSEGGDTWNVLDSTGALAWAPETERLYTTAPYAGARYDFDVGDGWTLTPSVGTRVYVSSEFEDELAPCAALTLAREHLRLFVSHSRGVHYPGVYVRANSVKTWRSLEAETLDTTETGAHVELGDYAAIHATLFHSEVENRMEMVSSGGASYYLNSGDLSSDGAEATLHLYPRKDLTLFVGSTVNNPDDDPVSRLPDFMGSAGASYRVARYVRWDVDSEYVASQYAYSMRSTTAALNKLDSYVTVNTRVSLDLKAFSSLKGELYVAVENLGDAEYEYFPGYPMPGVMWYTGMKLKF